MIRITLIHILFLIHFSSFSQRLMDSDKAMQSVIQDGLDKLYNFEFEAAETKFREVQKKYPQHPAYPFLMSQSTYWKMIFFNIYKEKAPQYLQFLEQTNAAARTILEKDSEDPEGIFFGLAINSSYSLYYSREKEMLKTVGYAKKTYEYMKEGFDLKSRFVDFYFSTGIYDYYIEQYPETHPIYKPFLLFFAEGNKERGLKELDHASKNGIFTKAESLFYLTNIYLKYENLPDKALIYSEKLAKLYPQNIYFISRHTESLINTGKFEEAEKFSLQLLRSGQKLFEMAAYVFYGQINEKHKNRIDHAKAYYLKAIAISAKVDFPDKNNLSFAYAGLGRICDKNGEKEKAKAYYEQALKFTDYTSVKKECEAYLE